MLELIAGLPDDVLGIDAKGDVTGRDYETVLIPAVEEKLSHRMKIRMLYRLGDEFTGFDAKALWDDAQVGIRHFPAWERIAVVTDHAWVRGAVRFFGIMMPGNVRVFGVGDYEQARQWICEERDID